MNVRIKHTQSAPVVQKEEGMSHNPRLTLSDPVRLRHSDGEGSSKQGHAGSHIVRSRSDVCLEIVKSGWMVKYDPVAWRRWKRRFISLTSNGRLEWGAPTGPNGLSIRVHGFIMLRDYRVSNVTGEPPRCNLVVLTKKRDSAAKTRRVLKLQAASENT